MRTVSVLCTSRRSAYHDIIGVECYDKRRDARTFPGNTPIIAHPPCRGWSVRLKHLAKPEPGEMELGLWCCEQLRKCGGVLEQPAFSELLLAGGLPRPDDPCSDDLWSMKVWQAWWGYPMQKTTWLVFAGIDRMLIQTPLRLHARGQDRRRFQRMTPIQKSATTPEFAQWLVDAARLSTTLPF